MRIFDLAERYVNEYAGTGQYDIVRAARAACNSDTAFVAWCKRGFDLNIIRRARDLQLLWKRIKASKTTLITSRAIKAAIIAIMKSLKVSLKTAKEILSSILLSKNRRAKANCAFEQMPLWASTSS